MKKTRKQWAELIIAEHKGKGKSGYYEATCPICTFSKTVDVLGSASGSKGLAKFQISSHIDSEHADQIVPEGQ